MLERKLANSVDRIIAKTVIQLLELTQYKNTELVVQALVSILDPSRVSDQTMSLLAEAKSSLAQTYNKKDLDEKVKAYYKYVLECYINGLLSKKIDKPVVEEKKSSHYDCTQTLFYRTLTGTTHSLRASSTDTILHIKEIMNDQERWPIDNFLLIFGGKVLSDNHTLADYNITNECYVDVVLNMRGD